MANRHLQHIKSSQTGKIPTASDLLYGEIAVNYANGSERLFIKNEDNEIVPFYPSTYIDEVEKVIAQALADTDERITNANNEVIRITGLLNDEIDTLDDKIDGEVDRVDARIDEAEKYSESITYSELKAKRDNGELVPGRFYRITDYQTTTTQALTMSANNQFDIIVLALDENTLSENAHATQHEGDTYFNDCKLSAWKLKYRLDNDVNNFIWADSTNGKGVIYYMKDEWDNECPYDFKNIMFKRFAISEVTSGTLGTNLLNHLGEAFMVKTSEIDGSSYGKFYGTKTIDNSWITNSTGVTFGKNENSSQWYYTFNGLSSTDGDTVSESYDMSVTHFHLSQECITWMSSNNGHAYYNDICRNNVITPYYGEADSTKIILNNIVFINGLSYCYYDNDNAKWQYSTSHCAFNKFGYGSRDITIGSNAHANTFGELTCNNLFGNDMSFNSFGDNIDGNVFCGNAYENVIGRGFCFNTCDYQVSRNVIGNSNFQNVYGNTTRYNVIGNDFQNNFFNENIQYNNFGNGCSHINLANYCWNNNFGNAVKYITFEKAGMFNIVENGNSFITLTSTTETARMKNIRISQGTNTGNTEADRKTITHNRSNNIGYTVYKNSESSTVDV